jgi:hypothetical protein
VNNTMVSAVTARLETTHELSLSHI